MGVIIGVDMDGALAEYAAERVEDFYQDGYFRNLKPNTSLIHFLKILGSDQDVELFAVSACITEKAEKEKNEWLDEYFPEIDSVHRVFVPVGTNKAKRMEKIIGRKLDEKCMLFDDYSPNCFDWENAGGTAIKVNNGKNCSGRNWQGLTISLYKPNQEIF